MPMVAKNDKTPVKTKNWASDEKSPGNCISLVFSFPFSPHVTETAGTWSSLKKTHCLTKSTIWTTEVLMCNKIKWNLLKWIWKWMRQFMRCISGCSTLYGVIDMGGEITATGKSNNGKKPLHTPHETSRFLEYPCVHGCVSKGLK